MSYSVDELFSFRKVEDGYALTKYLKKDDPSITELELPAEFNGEPVTIIGRESFLEAGYLKRVVVPPSVRLISVAAFYKCSSMESAELCEGLKKIGADAFADTSLKSIVLPKSVKRILSEAFRFCKELERVEFNSSPTIEMNVFGCCPKLPPETVVMGLVCSTDITKPIQTTNILWRRMINNGQEAPLDSFRPDVFELLLKNNCFQDVILNYLLEKMANDNNPQLFSIAERYGLLEDAELVDNLTDYTVKNQRVEITAYLLELKRRKFGFNGGGDFEL